MKVRRLACSKEDLENHLNKTYQESHQDRVLE